MAEKNDLLERELHILRKEYEKHRMTDFQVRQLQEKIREAKEMDQNNKNHTGKIRIAVASAAVAAGLFVILPNTSGTIAHAMEQIPIIGQLVRVVTFRDYEYEGDRNMADIEVPEIKPEEQLEDSTLQENIDRTTAEINAEIQSITDDLIAEFEKNLDEEMGYQLSLIHI